MLIMRMRSFCILIVSLLTLCGTAMAQLTEQQQIQKLNYVYSYIRNNYVDEDVSLEPLVEEAIRATLAELDPHSNYLTKEEMAEARNRLSGELVGIGIRYVIHNDTLVVRSVMDNSPASRVDIRPNDRIITVDNQSIVATDTKSAQALLKGEPNSNVRLQVVRRNNQKIIDIKLKREQIDTSPISAAYRVGNVGYIAISTFTKSVDKEFYAAYKELGDISALVVDLRDNGGGSLNGAIDLTSLFLEKGDIIDSQTINTRNFLLAEYALQHQRTGD
jgi:carboxyl-terminal processing protease